MSTAPAGSYDLIIIGGGPAGYVGAIRAAQLGLRTALVEREKLGGTCLHVGCIPTKVLLHTAELLETMRRADELGIAATGVSLDYAKLRRRMERVVGTNFRGVEFLMRKHGIAVFPGDGRVVHPTRVRVAATDGSEAHLDGRHILLATGSRPRSLPGVAIDNRRVLDNAGALRLPEVPRSIAILGAGAVGTEFASLFAAFGSAVTLVEMMPTILPLEDDEVSAVVSKALAQRGVTVRPGTAVAGVTAHADGVRVALRAGAVEEVVEAEYALVAVGRAPVVEELGLEAAGLEPARGGIRVDERMRTAVPSISAAGDVTGGLLLAHVASAEATLAVEAIAGNVPPALDPTLMPRATYSIPQVASCGLTEREARERGHDVAVGRFPFAGNARAAILGHREGFVKIVSDRALGEILGVHLVGPEVTELLPEGVLGKTLEATVLEIGQAVHAHPTLSEAVKEAALAALGRAVHA
ncbi:MAG TPA: dihydrolipoyl dehydrogenase [bacterium]|nr:dihydrolipoyl dehydrogenase [bacterium]